MLSGALCAHVHGLRESMGVSADSTQRAFPSADVDSFLKRVYPGMPRDSFGGGGGGASHVVISVDPAGGGSSQFAVFSLAQSSTGSIVCLGAEALRTKDVRDTHKLVVSHIQRIRSIPEFEDAVAVLVLESNLAFEAQHLMHALNQTGVRRWVALSEGAGGSVGWLTTNERKESMCFQLRDSLRVGCIGRHKAFFSLSQTAGDMLKMLADEMRNFCILVEPPKTPFGKQKKTYSGKVGGRNDDIIIAMQLAITGCRCFHQNEKYRNFRDS